MRQSHGQGVIITESSNRTREHLTEAVSLEAMVLIVRCRAEGRAFQKETAALL